MARSRVARRWQLAGTLAVAGLLATGCTADDLPRFGWPSGATDRAKEMQHFWSWACIAALAVGVIVWGLMFWSFAVYRKRKNSPLYPKQTRENLPLELVYTAVPFVMVAVLFYFTVGTENKVLDNTAHPDVEVCVTAQKWSWDFSYGKCSDAATAVHTIGTATEVPVLVVPSNKVVQYELQSKDVIHSFWVIDFLFKRDVFPDPEANNTENIFQNTILKPGSMVGRCAELCGTYHSAMNFEIRALPDNLYQSYIKLRSETNPATGGKYTTAGALAKLKQDNAAECGSDLCNPTANTTYPLDTNREAKAASQPQSGGK